MPFFDLARLLRDPNIDEGTRSYIPHDICGYADSHRIQTHRSTLIYHVCGRIRDRVRSGGSDIESD